MNILARQPETIWLRIGMLLVVSTLVGSGGAKLIWSEYTLHIVASHMLIPPSFQALLVQTHALLSIVFALLLVRPMIGLDRTVTLISISVFWLLSALYGIAVGFTVGWDANCACFGKYIKLPSLHFSIAFDIALILMTLFLSRQLNVQGKTQGRGISVVSIWAGLSHRGGNPASSTESSGRRGNMAESPGRLEQAVNMILIVAVVTAFVSIKTSIMPMNTRNNVLSILEKGDVIEADFIYAEANSDTMVNLKTIDEELCVLFFNYCASCVLDHVPFWNALHTYVTRNNMNVIICGIFFGDEHKYHQYKERRAWNFLTLRAINKQADILIESLKIAGTGQVYIIRKGIVVASIRNLGRSDGRELVAQHLGIRLGDLEGVK